MTQDLRMPALRDRTLIGNDASCGQAIVGLPVLAAPVDLG